ncbi:MAG: cation diffusion facilitator family transporter [Rudaea sp.]
MSAQTFKPHIHTSSAIASRRLAFAFGLTLLLVGIELAAGLVANSLALVTDAVHNVSDALAVGLSWWALRLAQRPANDARTFGYHRAGILVALLNAATLIGLALLVGFEALQRISQPPEVRSGLMLVVGAIAFVLNAATALLLWRDSRHDLNIRSAFVHMAADAVSVLGVIAAAIGIALLGLENLDSFASVLIAALILWSAWGILKETVDILLESTPRDVDVNAMVQDILGVRGVRGLHDLHVWSISSSFRALSAHVLTEEMTLAQGAKVQNDINDLLLNRYAIGHSALQLESINCEPGVLYCELCGLPVGGNARQAVQQTEKN